MKLYVITTQEKMGELPIIQIQKENEIIKAYSSMQEAFNNVPLQRNSIYYCYTIETNSLMRKHIITPTEMYACYDSALAIDINEWGLSKVVIYEDLNIYLLREWEHTEVETWSFDDVLTISDPNKKMNYVNRSKSKILNNVVIEPLVKEAVAINSYQSQDLVEC